MENKRKGYTSQEPQIATEHDVYVTKWGGSPPGERFRCYICAHKFEVGDYWRWIYNNVVRDNPKRAYWNIIVCKNCDTPDATEKFADIVDRYSWLFRDN